MENKDREMNAVNQVKIMGVAPHKKAEVDAYDHDSDFEFFSQTHASVGRP
jgi:hypothetical protein